MSRRSDIIEANVRGGGITKRVCPVVSLLRSQTIEVSFVDSRVWQDRVHFRERLLTTIPQRVQQSDTPAFQDANDALAVIVGASVELAQGRIIRRIWLVLRN